MPKERPAVVAAAPWHDCAKDPPDADTTVLIYHPDWDDHVWLGYLDTEGWIYVDGSPPEPQPLLWRQLPYPDDKEGANKPEIASAFELGFRCREKGMNLQMAMEYLASL
jgi:hypothetical protein